MALLQLLRWLLGHGKESGVAVRLVSGRPRPQLASALTAMHERPHLPWTVEALTRKAAMSRSSFAGRIKQAVGSAPADYLAH